MFADVPPVWQIYCLWIESVHVLVSIRRHEVTYIPYMISLLSAPTHTHNASPMAFKAIASWCSSFLLALGAFSPAVLTPFLGTGKAFRAREGEQHFK